MQKLIVDSKFNNKKIIQFLTNKFPNVPQSTFYKALRKKDIRINDIKISENILIHTGDEIKLYILDKYLTPSFSILDNVYEDNNILIIYKPKGIEVNGKDSLTSILQQKYESNIYPCHRLDRNTEGLVLFAKSENVLEILNTKFKSHEITKIYKCKVYGTFNKKHNILKSYLFKDSKKSLVYISDLKQKGYKEIITEYKVLEENFDKNYSILEIILHTGRTHQIRAHLAYIGHPIIGDRQIWR